MPEGKTILSHIFSNTMYDFFFFSDVIKLALMDCRLLFANKYIANRNCLLVEYGNADIIIKKLFLKKKIVLA